MDEMTWQPGDALLAHPGYRDLESAQYVRPMFEEITIQPRYDRELDNARPLRERMCYWFSIANWCEKCAVGWDTGEECWSCGTRA